MCNQTRYIVMNWSWISRENKPAIEFLFRGWLYSYFRSNTTFKLKHRIRVCELWISDCVDDVTELTRAKERAFVIGWPTTNYVAQFKSAELKETWLLKFKEYVHLYVCKWQNHFLQPQYHYCTEFYGKGLKASKV